MKWFHELGPTEYVMEYVKKALIYNNIDTIILNFRIFITFFLF